MKSFTPTVFIAFLIFVHVNLLSQGRTLIIGNVTDSMYVHDFEDVVLNTGDNGYLTYYLDLDYDNNWDLKFSIGFGSGWWGGSGGINLYASHGTLFTVDTLATQWIGPCGDLYLDTTSTVYKHSLGDTLKIDDYFSDTNRMTRIDVWSDPCYIEWWLDDWVGGEHYIGIKTIVNGSLRLGWLKVEVKEHYHIVLKEFALDSDEIIKPDLRINEYMIWNQSTIMDEYGEYEEWVEIYNPGSDSVWLGSHYLTNDITDSKKWRMPEVYIPAGGFILFWADAESSQGPFHTNFDLRYGKTVMGILDYNGFVIEKHYMGDYYPDISEGRYPNGGPGAWVLFHHPTPGESNEPLGLSESPNTERISVFPNPAVGSKVFLSEPSNYEVYNSWGQKIHSAKNSQEFNISKYNNGVYIVVIDSGQKIKLIVN